MQTNCALPTSELVEFKAANLFTNVFNEKKKVSLPEALTVVGFTDDKNPAIPTAHEDYVFRAEVLRDILAFLAKPNNDGLYLTGPAGSGKTSAVNEVAARLHWPVQEPPISGHTEYASLVGHFGFQSSRPGETPQMLWHDGPLPLAMKYGHILLLNEVDLMDPSELIGLNNVLEGGALCIPENGGEIIHAHPMFRIIATANSAGCGDPSGRYSGVQSQNQALMDRFRMMEVDYQDATVETELLTSAVPTLTELIPMMVALANEVRSLYKRGQISTTFSTRTLLRWARLTSDFRNSPNALEYALQRAFLARLRDEPEEMEAVRNLCVTVFGDAWKTSKKGR